ncbi:hypothetical protein PDJAM_G00212100 [Pangasius djambal]|uniref:Uncharacterized protein n=1 Tax=Pangasius djambal TaxID=1691987 RepID=A0ACC5Y9V5_9TELE|nr:hypothetical protein [Pangasius djambal]
MSRFAVVAWFLAVSCMDSRAAEPIQNMIVSVGQNVILPCPCSEDTNKLVWQIGEEIVVNHCCEAEDPPHESYVNRTQVFLSFTKGNCSLLLRDVSLNDVRTFTCYIFNGEESLEHMHEVGLKVEENDRESHTGFSVGVPLSLILVILAGLIVALLIRKHRQRRPRMVVIQDPQAKLPIMNHNPV